MWVDILISFACVYAAAGVIFALAFVIAGVQRIDAQAENSGIGFRLFIFPGAAALWPLLLKRWRNGVKLP